jgi:predicted AAA+ superfamily ATPase
LKQFINRRLAKFIQDQRTKFPILAVTGPRQSGKTTLLRNIFSDYEYISLENPNTRSFALEDPVGFLKRYDNKVILDEIQKVPELFAYLQEKADNATEMGRYILSGSQNFHLLNNITQTLAGRVALFKLLPLDIPELKSAGLLENDYPSAIIKGFYPATFDRNIDPAVFYANYVETYIEKDVTELLHIRSLHQFRTLLNLCAGRAGQLVNYSALANECDCTHTTVKSWLSILQSSYLIFLLHPYHANFNKRIVKSPKLYFYDTGLLAYLLGIRTKEDLEANRLKGPLFENMVVAEYQKTNHHTYQHQQLFFWQDTSTNEIDILSKEGDGFSLTEIKSTQTISADLFKQLDRFETIVAPAPVKKNLVYGGKHDEERSQYTIHSWQNI